MSLYLQGEFDFDEDYGTKMMNGKGDAKIQDIEDVIPDVAKTVNGPVDKTRYS